MVAGAVAATAVIWRECLRIRSLAAGGAAVAAMAGARQVAPGTRDALERRLLNVVEEMAIASGVRVPAVYVMDDEPGINAFAAGWEVSSAALAVTRGALQVLTRDELQGVVAHEFSHILNGDMRLNIRMLGVLAGIVALAVAGRVMMGARGSRSRGQLALAGLAVSPPLRRPVLRPLIRRAYLASASPGRRFRVSHRNPRARRRADQSASRPPAR